ncbi:tail fiber assembly protein [Pseudomonas sp. TNT11]|uniref:Tail fiber assembly protein n=1 Tax=Pseudomonas emilianonis TaxID=2915812 RepID=A0ABT0ECH2_9PSED|nr:tail fiber assembly protein [Pseudomonas emilianonis]MCK1783342.1 tail fiber assembly protein [Pseudomonas emilianonis]
MSNNPGYAYATTKAYAFMVDGPEADPDNPQATYPNYEVETFWPLSDGFPPIVPSPAERLAQARIERDRLLTYATLRINPLQDDVDNDESSPEGAALLKLWKQYRSAVSKTETKPGWPDAPQWPDPPIPLE